MKPPTAANMAPRLCLPRFFASALLVFCAGSGIRADVYWNNNNGEAPGGDRRWGNAANWIGGSPSAPGAGNAIVKPWNTVANYPVVDTAGNTAADVYLDADASLDVIAGGGLSAANLVTGIWGGSGPVSVSGGSISLSGYLNMGAGGFDGDVDISGGSVTAANLSINSGGGARLNLRGSGRFVVTYSAGTLGNIEYWVTNSKSITAFGNTDGWWVNVDTNSSAGNLVLTSAGLVDSTTVTYSNVMSYLGPTVVTNNGTLNLSGGDNRLSTTTNVIVHTGTLNLGGNSQTVTGLTGQGTVTNSAGTLTLNVAGAATFGGSIAGAGSVAKSGSGSMTLAGSNSFTGALAVNAGTLKLDSAAGGAAGSASGIGLAGGATLLVSRDNQVNDNTAVTLSGGTIVTAAGVSEVFGNLELTSASFLEFGNGASGHVSFGTYTPGFLLTVNNFASLGTLVFKSNLSSSITNPAFFAFNNGGIGSYAWDEGSRTFTVTAIPEPSAWIAAAALLGLLLWRGRSSTRCLREG